MKLRIEIAPDVESEEIVIRCRTRTDEIAQIEQALARLLCRGGEMVLTLGDTEYYVPHKEILFFETHDGKIAAHTVDRMYYTSHKLFELEALLPRSFVRVSKSCILNVERVTSLSHNLTGASRVTFRNTEKVVYVSRSYYKILREAIEEIRLRAPQTPIDRKGEF